MAVSRQPELALFMDAKLDVSKVRTRWTSRSRRALESVRGTVEEGLWAIPRLRGYTRFQERSNCKDAAIVTSPEGGEPDARARSARKTEQMHGSERRTDIG
jgi:hypothetical protein